MEMVLTEGEPDNWEMGAEREGIPMTGINNKSSGKCRLTGNTLPS